MDNRKYLVKESGISYFDNMKKNYECIALLSTDNAASFTASEKVGWAWHVRAISSALAPNSIATPISAINSPACGPIMWAPSTLSVCSSA